MSGRDAGRPGRFRYTSKKDLHLFATVQPRRELRQLRCESHYLERWSGRQLPEMDGFGWFAFERVRQLCTPKMAAVLDERVALHELFGACRTCRSAQPPSRTSPACRPARALDLQQFQLRSCAAGRREAAGLRSRREHAVARHDDRERVLAECRADRARRVRFTHCGGDLAVGARAARMDRARDRVDAAVEFGDGVEVECNVFEVVAGAFEERLDALDDALYIDRRRRFARGRVAPAHARPRGASLGSGNSTR